MPAKNKDELFAVLKSRFEKNMLRHKDCTWAAVRERLEAAAPATLRALQAMEATGGEPDVVARDEKTGAFQFFDCAPESPLGRRSLCYDRAGLESRKEHRPQDSAMDMAAAMGVEILSEAQYRALQALGAFDLKTSSWIATPAAIRKLGGALFGDRRYDTVFVYHNGAQSYYASRGFRAALAI